MPHKGLWARPACRVPHLDRSRRGLYARRRTRDGSPAARYRVAATAVTAMGFAATVVVVAVTFVAVTMPSW